MRAVVRMQVPAEPWKPDPGLGWPDVLAALVPLRVTRGGQVPDALGAGAGPANRGPRPTTGVGGLSSESDPSRALAAHVVDLPVREQGPRRIRRRPGRERQDTLGRLRLNDLLNGLLAEGERRRTATLVQAPALVTVEGHVTRSRSVIGPVSGISTCRHNAWPSEPGRQT
jgi:hypothetical protein